MSIAWRELRRRPGRFLPVGAALSLLVLLLVVIGGFLDGLELSQTGAYRVLDGRVLVFADDADLQRARSRISADTAAAVRQVPEVAEVGGLSAVATTASAGDADPMDVTVFAYESGTDALPAPEEGAVVVDAALREMADVAIGDELAVGPASTPLRIAAFVEDASEGAPTLWAEPETWRRIAAEAQPAATPPAGEYQILVVTPAADAAPAAVADAIDAATGDTTTVEVADAIEALAVVAQQSATLGGIIGVTFVVCLLVVALFFALITLERVRLFAVLKALGAGTRDLVAGLAVQALGVALGALVVGGAAAVAFVAVLPPDLPVRIVPARLLIIVAGTLATALLGALLTLRRVTRIDPAQSIG